MNVRCIVGETPYHHLPLHVFCLRCRQKVLYTNTQPVIIILPLFTLLINREVVIASTSSKQASMGYVLIRSTNTAKKDAVYGQ